MMAHRPWWRSLGGEVHNCKCILKNVKSVLPPPSVNDCRQPLLVLRHTSRPYLTWLRPGLHGGHQTKTNTHSRRNENTATQTHTTELNTTKHSPNGHISITVSPAYLAFLSHFSPKHYTNTTFPRHSNTPWHPGIGTHPHPRPRTTW